MPDTPPARIRIPNAERVSLSLRQTRRLGDVLLVLARNGFVDIAAALRSGRGGRGHAEPPSGTAEAFPPATRAERIRRVIEELGPTFVKLGQVLSTRADLVPPDLLVELTKLQDQVPPFPFEAVREIVEAELGAPLEAVFDSFDPEPLAAASLGQVHRAGFGGEEVVVKVQRPGIRETIDADLALMRQLASLLERRLEGWEVHQPTRAVQEFADTIAEELDYEVEAAHQERIAGQFASDPTVYIPFVFREVTTPRVLTMEYIDGIKVSEVERLQAAGADLPELARRGLRLVIEQTLAHGFFHADPHPGNILILPGDVICFIDFGMMGRIGRDVRDDFVALVFHIVDGNTPRAAETILRLTGNEGAGPPEFEREVARFMDRFVGVALKDVGMAELLREVLAVLARHGLRIPPDLFLMLKAITEIEAVAVSLDPDFDLVAEGGPQVRRIFLDRYRPERLAEEGAEFVREWSSLIRDTPNTIRALKGVFRGGEIRIGLEHQEMPEILAKTDRMANRLAFSFVLGAALIGSSIVAAAAIPPLWNGISVLGLGGFVVTLVMSGWLLASILRHGRL